MVDAWMDALNHQYHGDDLSLGMIRNWGCLIEPTKNDDFRRVPIYVGDGWTSVPKTRPELILVRFERWFELLPNMTAMEAYVEFEEIHPFLDGNGRTGKIILNWVNGSLLDPIFPPKDIWGKEISNP